MSSIAADTQAADGKVFVDKRAPHGHKLMLNNSPLKATVNAANNGFALSPLARRGQTVIALGASSSRRPGVHTKTPLSKLLTTNEMAVFQRVLAGGHSSKVAARRNPGEFFKSGPAARELLLNQVSTSLITDHNVDKASKINLKTKS
jgi:hypothetical protein